MNQFGPPRGEIIFRLCFSLIGLGLMIFAVLYRGIGGIAAVEIVGIAGAFFGGTAIWSIWQLRRMK
ncbi:hypothetical protein [Litoreibacter roseus]|nr:hypothetical protein [Litoreibacter roseus]